MMNTLHPFDLRAAIFAKHAQHVVIIHFPLALFVVGVVFDYIAQLTRKPALASAAYYNFLVAALSSPFAVATGILAWRFQLEGQKLHGILLLHLVMGASSAVLMCLVWWLHFRSDGSGIVLPYPRLAVELVAVMIVGLTGHLGGFLSGVNGTG